MPEEQISSTTLKTLIRAERYKRKWTQNELAESVGVDEKTVKRWERGISFPQPMHLHRLSQLLSIRYIDGRFTAADYMEAAKEPQEEQERLETRIFALEKLIEQAQKLEIVPNVDPSTEALTKIELIANRFHTVARQLRRRHADRATLAVSDEYDVQDLFHALLRLFFDDIRDEEWTPSYAGGASRIDFLLKQEQILVEIKMTRPGLTKAKDISDQLIIDSDRYRSTHPDCKMLVAFVYDPQEYLINPNGVEHDLSRTINGVPVKVFIRSR